MNKAKVLLIEDEPSLTAMYQAVFRDSPYELLVTQDAKNGFDTALEHIPSLILLDVIIPNKEGEVIEFNKRVGFDLLTRLKKNEKTKAIPVLALTNLDSPEDRTKAEKLGAKEYLIKANYLPREVVEKVKHLLKNS